MSLANPFPSMVGPLSVGEVKLLSDVEKRFGPAHAFTLHSALDYYGNVTPGSEGLGGAKGYVAKIEKESLDHKGLGLMAVGAIALPTMFGMALAGAALVPVLAVGAAGAAIGLAGIALRELSGSLSDKLAERRLNAAAEQTAVSTIQPVFPDKFKP